LPRSFAFGGDDEVEDESNEGDAEQRDKDALAAERALAALYRLLLALAGQVALLDLLVAERDRLAELRIDLVVHAVEPTR